MRKLLTIAALAAMLGGCTTVVEQPNTRLGQATLQYADGAPAGTAHLIGQGDRLDVSIALTGMQQGVYGLRLIAAGDCTGAAMNAAADFRPRAGLPDAIVNSSGNANVSATLPGMQPEVLADIFDNDGTALAVGPADVAQNESVTACGVFTRC